MQLLALLNINLLGNSLLVNLVHEAMQAVLDGYPVLGCIYVNYHRIVLLAFLVLINLHLAFKLFLLCDPIRFQSADHEALARYSLIVTFLFTLMQSCATFQQCYTTEQL